MGAIRVGSSVLLPHCSTAAFTRCLIRSEVLVFHETTGGPFRRDGHRVRPWAPDDTDAVAGRRFLADLAERVDEMTESLLDFYRRHQISPVRQDIRDLRAHFGRRAALYRHVGILPRTSAAGRRSRSAPDRASTRSTPRRSEPSRYVLVEAQPAWRRRHPTAVRRQYPALGRADRGRLRVGGRLQQSRAVRLRVLRGHAGACRRAGSRRLLRTVAGHTAPGGVLVITCIDAIVGFSEILRRFVAQLLIDPAQDLADHVERLLPVFSSHLSTLKGMSRRHDDWIVDNLLNPASIGPLLSIADAIAALDGEFDVFGASPKFLTDWRWYKDITGEGDRFNELRDRRPTGPTFTICSTTARHLRPRDPIDNRRPSTKPASPVRTAVQEYERDRDRGILALVLARSWTPIVAEPPIVFPITGDALADLRIGLAQPTLDTAASRRVAGSAVVRSRPAST